DGGRARLRRGGRGRGGRRPRGGRPRRSPGRTRGGTPAGHTPQPDGGGGGCGAGWPRELIRVQGGGDDAGRALAAAAGGPIAQGAVGAGTGMICFGWEGGVGSLRPVRQEAAGTRGGARTRDR